jgi:hypothetical protein
MAATATVLKKYSLGRTGQLIIGKIAWDNSYPTGGEALTITDVEYVHHIEVLPTADNDFVWDLSATSPKIKARVSATGAEVANAVDLSALTDVRFVAITG